MKKKHQISRRLITDVGFIILLLATTLIPVFVWRLLSGNLSYTDIKSTDSKIVYNLPDEMTLRSSEKVTVRIARKPFEDILRNLEGNGNPEILTIQSVHTAKVTLKGDSEFFDISLKNGEEEKNISTEDATDWFFEVIPKQAGDANLYLNINVINATPNGSRSIKEYPLIGKVKVHNNRFESFFLFIQSNILTILGLIVALVVGLMAVGFIGNAAHTKISELKSRIVNSFKRNKETKLENEDNEKDKKEESE